MKSQLQLTISNQLTLTPQLQQAIRLLQLSNIELLQEIQQVLEKNPMLEAVESDYDLEETIVEDETTEDFQWIDLYQENKTIQSTFNENDYIFENKNCTKETLKEHLLWQINLMPLSNNDKFIAQVIIDSINDNGFLTSKLTDIIQSISFDVTLDEVNAVLHLIQHLDPVGCGAKDLQETLLIQFNDNIDNFSYANLTLKLLNECLDFLASHNFAKIKAWLKINDATLEIILNNLKCLNPMPGSAVTKFNPDYVVPDLFVKKINDIWQVFLNPEILPKIKINDYYAAMLNKSQTGSDKQFFKNNLKEAKWFLKGVENRYDTLLKVAKFIVNYQQEFFNDGFMAMKPLVLQDVANAIGMHESTISRVTSEKYIHTPQGIFELKRFFSKAIARSVGEDASSIAIKAQIKKFIVNENHSKPLSDAKLVNLLKSEGVKVARRTITKYREEMGIAASYERKQIPSPE